MTKDVLRQRNIPLLNIYAALLGFLPIIAVIVPYYQHQIGLSFQDFLIIEAIFSAVVVAMEVPSGWLSDLWRRKFVLALGAFLDGVGFVFIGIADDFWTAALGEIILGVGVSLVSGTTSALLYDTLLEDGDVSTYRKLEGKRSAMGFYAVGVSSVVAGFLYTLDPYLPLWVSAVTTFLCIPVALMMHEPDRHKEAVQKNPLHDMVQVMRYALNGHKEVAALIFFVAVLYGSTQAGQWMQQSYYIFLGIPEIWFGIFASIGFFVGGVGGHLGHKLEEKFRAVHILIGLWLLVALFWIICGTFAGYHALILLMISNAAWGIGSPVMQDALNRRVDSSRRATVLSVASLMIRLTFIPLGVGIGWVVDAYGVQTGLLALAAFVLLANVWNARRLL
ncbi:MAG: MFS transporter [Rhodospirillales bacterium]|nr:MFS transporter [Rhodospirillales bacterium]